MCQKRHRFRSRYLADNMARLLQLKLGGRLMTSYRCPQCKRWCLTSKGAHPRDVFKKIPAGRRLTSGRH